MICRASEQKRVNVTEHFNSSFPQQLDLDLYLGVYAGEPCRRARFFLCTIEALNVSASSLAVAQGLQGSVYVYMGLSCTGR